MDGGLNRTFREWNIESRRPLSANLFILLGMVFWRGGIFFLSSTSPPTSLHILVALLDSFLQALRKPHVALLLRMRVLAALPHPSSSQASYLTKYWKASLSRELLS